MTPLQKHRGQHGGLIALVVLVSTIAVVVLTEPKKKAPPPTPPPRPQAAIPAPREPAPPPPTPAPRETGTLSGTIDFDQRRTHHVAVPVYGWLQKSRASSIGRRIRAGETLGVIWSPEVYLTTAEVVAQVKNYTSPEAFDRARMRLLRWGMRREQLIAIEKSGKPSGDLPLIARVSGIVVAEPVLPAPLVDPNAGVELFTITDPSYARMYLDVPVAYADRLTLATTVKVTIDGIGRPVTATIGYIARRVEDGTRMVRFEVHDPGLRFTPGTKATVQLGD